MLESYEIRNEDDLFRALEMIEEGDWPADLVPHFVDWPHYEIVIEGEDFDGGIPTRVLPALTKLQWTMNRAFSRSVHGYHRRLNSRERRQAQLIIRLEPGSTKFIVALSKLLNAAFENMSGAQKVQTIVFAAALFAIAVVHKTKVEEQTKRLEFESQLAVEAHETRRLEIFADQASQSAELAADMAEFLKELLKRLDKSDRLFINGERIGDTTLEPEFHDSTIENYRISSDFRIVSVTSGRVASEFKFGVLNLKTGERLRVSVFEHSLPREDMETLRRSIWDRNTLEMEIAVERRGGKIRYAKLLSVDPAAEDES